MSTLNVLRVVRTGSTDSEAVVDIGKETTRVLLNHNAKVYIACRPSAKTTAAVNELKVLTGKTGSSIVVLPLDLSDLDSIKTAVDTFLR